MDNTTINNTKNTKNRNFKKNRNRNRNNRNSKNQNQNKNENETVKNINNIKETVKDDIKIDVNNIKDVVKKDTVKAKTDNVKDIKETVKAKTDNVKTDVKDSVKKDIKDITNIVKETKSIKDYVKDRNEKVKNDTRHKETHKNVPNKIACDKLKGVWEIVNKMCWKTEDDKTCASNKNDTKKICNENKQCVWNKKACNSRKTISNAIDYIPDGFPTDLTTPTASKEMAAAILKDPIISYSKLIGEGNRCTSINFNKKELSLAQAIIHTIGKSIAISNETTNRGMLCWHSTGSGKTITSMAIMDAFWKSNKNIVFVSSFEALQSNPPTTYYKNAKYLKRFADKSEQDIEEMFNNRDVKFMSFAQLAHFLLISRPLKSVKTLADKEFHATYLANAVIIIDEVQNIFHPLPNQREEHNAVKKFLLDESSKLNKNMKVFILTATPGDSIDETIDLLNMVRDRKNPKIVAPDMKNNIVSLNVFKKSINGLVSYFNSTKDLTRFPHIIKDNTYSLEMLQKQFEAYVEAFNKTKVMNTNFNALNKDDNINAYYKTLRKYSNMQYNFETKDPIAFFSNKIPKLLDIVRRYKDDKHYVYSAFHEKRGFGGQGIRAVANFLEKELGYIRITSEKDLENMTINKRGYVLAITNELKNKEHLNTLVKLYNDSKNVNVFLASQAFNEGVDLKNTKHIHMFEPMITYNAEKQTIGRAVRFCSHSDLPYDEWTVSIHRYISEIPKDLTMYEVDSKKNRLRQIDESMSVKDNELLALKGIRGVKELRDEPKKALLKLSKEKRELSKNVKEINAMNIDKIINIDELIYRESLERVFEQYIMLEVLKQKALDCNLMKTFHEKGGEDIECM